MKRRKVGTNSNALEAAVRGAPDPVYGGYILLLAIIVNKIVLDATRKKGNAASAGDLDLADHVIRRLGGESARCLDGLKSIRYPARQIELPDETAPLRVAPQRAGQTVQFYNVRTGVVTVATVGAG